MSTQTSSSATAGRQAVSSSNFIFSFLSTLLATLFAAVAYLGPSFILSLLFAGKSTIVEAEGVKQIDAPISLSAEELKADEEDDLSERSNTPSPSSQVVAPKVLKSHANRSSTPRTPALSVSSLESSDDDDATSPADKDEVEYFHNTPLIMLDAKEGMAFVKDKAFQEPNSDGPDAVALLPPTVNVTQIEEEVYASPLSPLDGVSVQTRRHVASDKEHLTRPIEAPAAPEPVTIFARAERVYEQAKYFVMSAPSGPTMSKRAKKKAKAVLKRNSTDSSSIIEYSPSPAPKVVIVPRAPGRFLTHTRIKKFKKVYRIQLGQVIRTDDARSMMIEQGWQAVKELLGDRY